MAEFEGYQSAEDSAVGEQDVNYFTDEELESVDASENDYTSGEWSQW